MSALLVSVRSGQEAAEALAGGADVIDVKDPERGSLGMAKPDVIQAVVDYVGGRRPVSAALGELRERANWRVGELASWRVRKGRLVGLQTHQSATDSVGVDLSSLTYLKVGLAGCASRRLQQIADQVRRLDGALRGVRNAKPGVTAGTLPTPCTPFPTQWVAVAYADWQRAEAPPPEQVAEMAAGDSRFWGAMLIDTWHKDGSTLVDWLSLKAIGRLCHEVQAAGPRVALAGSLGHGEIRRLLPLAPDLLAVRGAACRARDRKGSIDRRAVQELARMIHGAVGARSSR